MSAHWHIGMEVERFEECAEPVRGCTYPVVGKIYTIREIFVAPNGAVVILLNEIRNDPMPTTTGFREPGYNAAKFRPVQKRTTSIECFRSLLNPSKEDREEIELADFIIEHSVPFQ